MIILSQDKDIVINFDNVKSLWIDDNVLDKTNTSFYINADDEVVGEYKTEERAKEVLKEILMYNTRFNLCKYVCVSAQNLAVQNFLKNNVTFDLYEMPKE